MATSLRLLEALTNRFHLPFQVSRRCCLTKSWFRSVSVYEGLVSLVFCHHDVAKWRKGSVVEYL